MFKARIADSGTGGTHVRSRSALEGVNGNVLQNVKPDTAVFLKEPEKQG